MEWALQRAFRILTPNAPSSASLLILDELEAVGKSRLEARHVADLGALAALLEALDDPEKRRRVFVIGVAADAGRLDPALRQPGRLEGLVRLGTPAAAQRRVMLQGLLGRLSLVVGSQEEKDGAALLDELTRRTRGFTGADLARLCSEALAAAASAGGIANENAAIAPAHWEAALESARPVGIPWDAPVEAALSDLAGVEEAVRVVTQAVLLPLSRPQALKAMGIPRASTGVLLHGPPGTGKSLLGRALAAGACFLLVWWRYAAWLYTCRAHAFPFNTTHTAARPYARFLSVECPELVNKVVGESERAVARLFQTARQAAPCILFLDHVEAIAGRRGFDTSSEQTMDRLLSTLLVEMDGVGSSSSTTSSGGGYGEHRPTEEEAPVIVIAAANHRGLLDEALLRPGRLDLHVELPLPDAEARAAIFAHHLRQLPLAFDEEEEGEEEGADVGSLAAALAAGAGGLSGADIQGVCQEAALLSLRESLNSGQVCPRHLWAALEGAGM